MTCPVCPITVKKALERVPGVTEAKVDFDKKTASISFESRSKRGVGKATLDFDTKALRSYRMEGGAGDFHGVGQVCDLEH